MQWALPNDKSMAVITAEKHVKSGHGSSIICSLPKTCVIFEMGMAMGFIENNFETLELSNHLPCFLDNPKCIALNDNPNVCFTRGGYGAPAAVDTLETVRALGVKQVIVVGMCGGFAKNIDVGTVVIPNRIYSEEGTSQHYFEDITFVTPDKELFNKAESYFSGKFTITADATVTTDAVYRQTLAKEELWRKNGCVGVDMESSALLAVSKYYSIPAVSMLLCSDKHPINENDKPWDWGNTSFRETRENFVRESVLFALQQ